MIAFKLIYHSQLLPNNNHLSDFSKWDFLEDKPHSGKRPIEKLRTAKAQMVADMPAAQSGRIITRLKGCR